MGANALRFRFDADQSIGVGVIFFEGWVGDKGGVEAVEVIGRY